MELEGFCRGCLVKYEDPSALIQYSEKNRRLYVYSTGLQVKRNDLFTFQLCKGCYTNMKLSCRFKKQCRGTDKKFRQYMALKDSGTNVDFITFLKTNDDELAFRLPLSGSSTPFYQKNRDDDNESTSTSIRNFMTDILPADEIADTDSRIIREVIEEEADLLDDSLDSVWLQDDNLSVEDSRLDFSFSPFSTPKATSEERFETPQKLANDLEINSMKNLEINNLKNFEPNNSKSRVIADIKGTNLVIEFEKLSGNDQNIALSMPEIEFGEIHSKDNVITQNLGKTVAGLKGFYVENESIYNQAADRDLTIERNIELSLKENKTEYTLDELLNTPKPYTCNSGASTPTINNILFGESLDIINSGNTKINTQNYEYTNFYHDMEFFEELFEDYSEGEKETNENIERNYDRDNLICRICDKQYKCLSALKTHANKEHNHRGVFLLEKAKKYVCHLCGAHIKGFSNCERHMKRMHGDRKYKCRFCKIPFDTKEEFITHNKNTFHTMTQKHEIKNLSQYKCLDCNIEFDTEEEYQTHRRFSHKKPAKSKFSHTKPAELKFSHTTPAEPAFSHTTPAEPTFSHTTPAEPTFSHTTPAEPTFSHTTPAEPTFSHTTPAEPTFSHTTPAEPTFSHTTPAEPTFSHTTPAEPTFSHTTPAEPKFSHTTPAEPKFSHICIPAQPKKENNEVKCDICGATFARMSNLIYHMKRHKQTLDYKCDICLLAFARKIDLKGHMKTHRAVKEFKCYKCDMSFAKKANLKRHIEHRHDKRTKSTCAKCNKEFKRPSDLIKHETLSIDCVRFRFISKKDKKNKKVQNPTNPKKITVIEDVVVWPSGLGVYN